MNSTEHNPITINSVTELVTALSEGERTTYTQLIRDLNLPRSAFEQFCSWSTECYTRNCIVENEKFELILLCWEEGQVTPIHDHGGEECWVKIIEGEFKETVYKLNENGELNTIGSTISTKGDVSYMIDFMGCHRLENIQKKRSMSLHLYAKPIRNCQLFNEDTQKFVRKDLVYNTISDLMVDL